MNARQLCMKMPKKRIKIKGPSVTCSHTCKYQYIEMCVFNYLLNAYSVKFWLIYLLPNINAVHFYFFSYIGQCFHPATKKDSKIKILDTLR